MSVSSASVAVGTQAAERASFARFFAETQQDVYRAVLVVTRDQVAAEDATATAFLRAWERWPSVSVHSSPSGWVARVAINEAISRWRRAQRLIGGLIRDQPTEQQLPDPDLRAVIDGLPLRQRQAIALRIVLGLDERETAKALGIAPGTVGVHLSRALAACRAQLDESEEK